MASLSDAEDLHAANAKLADIEEDEAWQAALAKARRSLRTTACVRTRRLGVASTVTDSLSAPGR